jgi:hypothetical protein
MEWAEYCTLEPFGEWRDDVRNAQLCALIANVNRDPKRRPEPYAIQDFMLQFDKARPPSGDGEPKGEISSETIAWLFASAAQQKPDAKIIH